MASRGRPKAQEEARLARNAQYRKVLVDSAEQEFAEQGFEAARIQKVAERADLSVGTLYGLFASKTDLYNAVHLARGGELVQRVSAVMQGEDSPKASIERGIVAYVHFYADYPLYLRMQLHEGTAWAAMAQDHPQALQLNWRTGIGMVAGICQRGIDQGLFVETNAMRMAKTLTAVHQVQLADWVEQGLSESPEQLTERLITLFRRLYCS